MMKFQSMCDNRIMEWARDNFTRDAPLGTAGNGKVASSVAWNYFIQINAKIFSRKPFPSVDTWMHLQ